MVNIKGYSFNIQYNENPNEKKFYLLEKETNFINLFILTVGINENKSIILNLFDYYKQQNYEIIKNNFDHNLDENLYQLSNDSKILSYYDGKNICFIDLEKTIKNKKIYFFDNTKIQYNNIYSIKISNLKCICLNKNKNFFIIDLNQDHNVKSINYSFEKLLCSDKNNNFILVDRNDKIELHDLVNNTKIELLYKIKPNQLYLISTNGLVIIIDNTYINIYSNDNKVNKIKTKLDNFNLKHYIISINNFEDTINDKYNIYLSFYNFEKNIINIFYLNNNFNTFEIKIPEETKLIKYIYINSEIYYLICENNIIVYNINQYILLGLINLYLETEYFIANHTLNEINKTLQNFYSIKPIVSNKVYVEYTLTDIIKKIIINHIFIDIFSYYLALERTSENFMNDIFLCFMDYKEKFVNDKEKNIIVFYELLLIKIIYCYYLESSTNKKNILIFKEGEYNKYKNNNILGYVYIKGIFDLLFNNFIYCKKTLCYSVENSLFY